MDCLFGFCYTFLYTEITKVIINILFKKIHIYMFTVFSLSDKMGIRIPVMSLIAVLIKFRVWDIDIPVCMLRISFWLQQAKVSFFDAPEVRWSWCQCQVCFADLVIWPRLQLPRKSLSKVKVCRAKPGFSKPGLGLIPLTEIGLWCSQAHKKKNRVTKL